MTTVIERLGRMLRNEAELGYHDQCVQGGFHNFTFAWAAAAQKDGVPEAFIQRVRDWLSEYHTLDPDGRKKSLGELLGEVDAMLAEEQSHPSRPPAPSVSESDSPTQTSPVPPAPNPTPPSPLTLRELEAPLTRLSGIGEKNAEAFQRLGLRTIGDLLWYFPRRHVDYSTVKPINRLWYGETVTVLASVQDLSTRRTRRGTVTEVTVTDGSGTLMVTFFNQPWIETRFRRGQYLALSGKITQFLGRLCLSMPEWEFLDRQQIRTGGIVPVYGLTAGINQNFLRRQIHNVIGRLALRLRFVGIPEIGAGPAWIRGTAVSPVGHPPAETQLGFRRSAAVPTPAVLGGVDCRTALPADRRPREGHRGHPPRPGFRPSNEPPAAGGCWLRKNRRGVRSLSDRGFAGRSGRDPCAHRHSRGTALPAPDPAHDGGKRTAARVADRTAARVDA
jgi:hypothetical protein